MGDSENTFPSSKKRAAGRELSRDNPGLDDEEEVAGQETGTFKRASDEVLANRRIVKVKRSQTSSTPTSNPFAAIRLVPTATPVNNPLGIEKTASENADSPKSVNKETEKDDDEVRKPEPRDTKAGKENDEEKDELVGSDENTPASEKENDEKKDELVGNDENTPASEKENDEKKYKLLGNVENTSASEKENDEEKDKVVGNDENTPAVENNGNDENTPAVENNGNDENTPAPASVNSFKQLSSSQNAFTGIVGTGFSNSTFSFGSIPKPDETTFSSFSFGTNVNSSLFGNPDKTESTKILSMQEVHMETGEENEKTVFTADSILFEFLDGGWKERGKGELKVNVLTSGTRKARLVMRARGNYRLILNASIFPDMKLTNMDKKGITFACLNSTGEEAQNGLSTFALKFKDPSIVEEFRSAVMAHKGNTSSVSTLKTPENSPKASE